MYEQISNQINPEDNKEGDQQNIEGNELSADFITRHPEWVEPAKVEAISSPEILELESMISEFESKHSIEELLLITDLSPEDAGSHPVREPARLDLIAITEKFKYMKEQNAEIKTQIKRLSQAVGIISGGKLDHTR